jgi:hypothetical protein
MKRNLVACGLFLTWAVVLPGVSYACSCVEWRPQNVLVAGDLIAEGTVLSVGPAPETECELTKRERLRTCINSDEPTCSARFADRLQGCDKVIIFQATMQAEMRLSTVWKGPALDSLRLNYWRGNGGNCGIELSPGDKVAIRANQSDTGDWLVSLCSIATFGTFSSPSDKYGAIASPILERYRQETSALRSAADSSPNDVKAALRLAEHFERNFDRLEARSSYERVILLAPTSSLGYAGIGRQLFRQDRFKDALPYLQKAFDLDPSDKDNESLLRQAKLKSHP